MKFEIPIKTISEANARGHWSKRAKRARAQRKMAGMITSSELVRHLCDNPMDNMTLFRIKLTRIGKGRMDSDNLAGAMKAIRDGIAEAIGIDDGDPRMTWDYAQETGKAYSVLVEISL
jgi:hypothetical protein